MQALLWTMSALAVELGKDRRTLAKLLDGLDPDEETTDGAGRVTRKWRMARVFAHLHGSGEALDGPAERARKDKESADKLALENAERRGELAPIAEIADVIGGHIDRCCTRLDQIPDALGQFCEPRIATIVVPECRRLIHAARSELAADMAAIGTAAGRPVDATAEPDGEPVGRRESPAVERKQRRARSVAN